MRNKQRRIDRRQFATTLLQATALTAAGSVAVHAANHASPPQAAFFGVASGDVTSRSAVIWSRCDRPAQMIVEYATNEEFKGARRVRGPAALEATDLTAKLRLSGLPAGCPVYYRVLFEDLAQSRSYSEPTTGVLRTAPSGPQDVIFAWSGDTAGQGWGIDLAQGGMRTYETIRKLSPDFFVHCGDTIYADNPFPAKISLGGDQVWTNVVTDETSKVAESLAEFRAKFRYNLLDENVRRFNSQIPLFAQWDDHETTNNWYPDEYLLGDERYDVKSTSLLAARARRAFFDYMPIWPRGGSGDRIYRSIPYGPLLELFLLDMRSYRGPNSANRQESMSEASALLGREQLDWLKRRLLASRATWKVICSDMPLGLVVRDGPATFEGCANGNGPALGRELEIAELLSFAKAGRICNLVWLTADVHYAASHFYESKLARFADFDSFWEFVSGPLHAGTFGPSELDDTFGPQVRFCSVPQGMPGNRPPSEGKQFFGMVRIDARTRVMTVAHYNVAGERLWEVELEPRTD